MSDQFYCDDIDDGECSACGGIGYIEDDCTCMDDTCCCLNPEPPDCPECMAFARLRRAALSPAPLAQDAEER